MIVGIAIFKQQSSNYGALSGSFIFEPGCANRGYITGNAIGDEFAFLNGTIYFIHPPLKHGAYIDGYFVNNVKTSPPIDSLPRDLFDYSNINNNTWWTDRFAFSPPIKPTAVFRIVGTDTFAEYDQDGNFVQVADESKNLHIHYVEGYSTMPSRPIYTRKSFYDIVEGAYYKFFYGRKAQQEPYVWEMYLYAFPVGGPNATSISWTEADGGVTGGIRIFTSEPTLNVGTVLYANRELTKTFKELVSLHIYYVIPVHCDGMMTYSFGWNEFSTDKIFYSALRDQVPKDRITLDDAGAIYSIEHACASCAHEPLTGENYYQEDYERYCQYQNTYNYHDVEALIKF